MMMMEEEEQQQQLESQGGNLKAAENNREVSAYAVQCSKCTKWRLISTLEEYEDIREASLQNPWSCGNKDDKSCDDPSDIDIDSTRIWAMDKPNLPKSPAGFERGMTIRRDCSRLDVYYETSNGKKLRSITEVQKFLEANPGCKAAGITISDFSFRAPRVLENTIPGDIASSKKKTKTSNMVVDDYIYDY
ncbi:hypothetical protein C5167_035807 [Papaver somniferum]|uniref:methyl-CpG-binding domain-containing protein 4-like n=1 Tax=Papaver somniferum TaxID=3469 RepID=UPI000E6FF44F|nr:methyl-CpG-binding domain-containing protein 4-like [Papaver somniferum]RZC89812.1 hypothetical protein C5167_035807 [Papaver somniferum]